MTDLEFICSAATGHVRHSCPDFRERLAAGETITGTAEGSSITATLTPTSATEGTAVLTWRTAEGEGTATVPYCLDSDLGIDEPSMLCIGMTLLESRTMTKRVRSLENQRSRHIWTHHGINDKADNAIENAIKQAMERPYKLRDSATAETIYRVTVRETGSLQPGDDTSWICRVVYCGTDRTQARIAYHAEKPADYWHGFGSPCRQTQLEEIGDTGEEG